MCLPPSWRKSFAEVRPTASCAEKRLVGRTSRALQECSKVGRLGCGYECDCSRPDDRSSRRTRRSLTSQTGLGSPADAVDSDRRLPGDSIRRSAAGPRSVQNAPAAGADAHACGRRRPRRDRGVHRVRAVRAAAGVLVSDRRRRCAGGELGPRRGTRVRWHADEDRHAVRRAADQHR